MKKSVQVETQMKGVQLALVWVWRLRFLAEGDKLWAEGNKLWAEGNKLWAEGNKLRAEGNKLRAEGDKLWAEALIEARGNISIEWLSDGSCKLENGEVFCLDGAQ